MLRRQKQQEKPEKGNPEAGKSKQNRRRKGMTLERPILEPNAAGIDIGAREIFVAVPADAMRIRCGSSRPSRRIWRRWPDGW
jgi:hypothetical protein